MSVSTSALAGPLYRRVRLSGVQVMAFSKTGPMTFLGLPQDHAPARERKSQR